MGVEFNIVPSAYDEKLDDARNPEEVATELALGKALAVAEQYPECIVIGADTIVTIGGRQLEKPRDMQEAFETLEMLAGATNEVSTGLAVVWLERGMQYTGAETTQVAFKPLDEQAIRAYVNTGDPMDKAGSYGIQSGAAPLIDHIIGQYDTVVGLPTMLLSQFLGELGIVAKSVELEPPVRQII
jgi:septum formation protein